MSYLKRYDKAKNVRNITSSDGSSTKWTRDPAGNRDQDLDELLLAKAEKEVRIIKQRIATRKHREKKNV